METAIIIVLVVFVALLGIERVRAEVRFRRSRDDIRKRSISQSRAVLGGKFTEQMAPYLPEFKYDPTEARFIGNPVDLIVFPGLSSGEPTEVVIVEVKAGKRADLQPNQKRIRDLVEEGKVRFEVLHRPST